MQPRTARRDPTPRADVKFRQLWTSAASTRTHGLRARCAYPLLVLHPRADAEECAAALTCLCVFICTTLVFAGASLPGAVLSRRCRLRRICMKTNRAQRRVCAFTRTAGREWLFWSPLWLSHRPQCYVTRSLRCSNAGPHARPACLPACAWHYHTEWQLHHLLMMITGNMKEEKEKNQVRSVAQSAPGFPQVSLSIFGSR